MPLPRNLDPRAVITAAFLLAILAWDIGGLDLWLASLSGGPAGFPLRDEPWLAGVLHNDARRVAWGVVLVLSVAVIAPFGPFRHLPFARRLQIPASAILATGAVVALKAFSRTSCPWDLAVFGGVAHPVSHWVGWLQSDGGSGRCFPAGHAASGFAFMGGYFAWRESRPRLARHWLASAIALGVIFGVVQQLRGAHYLSHTLWTAWLCWLVVWLTDPLFAGADGELSSVPP